MVRAFVFVAVFVLFSGSSSAGVYAFVSLNTGTPPLFAVVHPPGFSGSGGLVDIGVCVSPSDPELIPTVQSALLVWSNLTPIVANCSMCMRVEDIGLTPPFALSAESVILHELGHVLGLDHVNLNLAGTQTSATNAVDTTVVDFGADGVRGSSDDQHFPQPPRTNPARIIHWFRATDNNPIAIDGTVIDDSTFTRARSELPAGHTWPMSANSDYREPGDDTADILGFPNTQSVMYSFQNEELVYSGLTADDVNMVRMAQTGLDTTAGTADDYTFIMNYEQDCSLADVEISFVDPFVDPDLVPGSLGVTVAFVTGIPNPPNLTQHFFMRPVAGQSRILVKLNDNLTWDFEVVFRDDFDSGTISSWTQVVM